MDKKGGIPGKICKITVANWIIKETIALIKAEHYNTLLIYPFMSTKFKLAGQMGFEIVTALKK